MPPPGWFTWLGQLCTTLGLRVVVVVQVEQDRERAELAARTLGAEVAPWEGTSHVAQERALRNVYGQSRLVIGDRLHGLIMAATEGAIPLGWVPSSSGKIRRHFDAVGFRFASEHEGGDVAELICPDQEMLDAEHTRLTVSVSEARRSLAKLSVDLETLRDATEPEALSRLEDYDVPLGDGAAKG